MGNSNSSDSGYEQRYDKDSLMESGIKIFDDRDRSLLFDVSKVEDASDLIKNGIVKVNHREKKFEDFE